MSILIESFKSDFTQVPNHIISDSNVSLKAKGLYLYMVSKPDNWEFSFAGMTSQLLESKETIGKIINELILIGYMDKIKNRVNGKQAVNSYILHLKPQSRSESKNENHKMRTTKSELENATTSNTDYNNKDKVIFKE